MAKPVAVYKEIEQENQSDIYFFSIWVFFYEH